MKKLLLLTALFTSLLIGFAACSDKEDIPLMDEGDPIQQYTIEGLLTYDDATERYALAVSKCTNEAVLNLASKDKIYIDPDKISEIVYPTLKNFVGKYISTRIGIDDVGRLLGNGMLTLESEILLAEARSTKDIFCDDTPDIFPEAYTTIPLSRSSIDISRCYDVVNVYIHVLRKTDGTGLNKEYVEWNVIDALNYYYNLKSSAHIKFQSIGSEYINYLTNDMIKNLDIRYNEKERNKIFLTNSHSDALDIYVLSYWDKVYPDGKLGGKANGIPSTAFILHPECFFFYSDVPAHEAGHCLGLFHTHHGTAEEGIPEYVDGSNSKDAGDFVKDTPADPNAWINGEYDSSKNLRDGHGDLYSPDKYNLMSYSHNSTLRLTPNQIDRVYYFLSTSSTVKNVTARHIAPTESDMGGTGNLHFSERTKTLTFPIAAEDEVVTWTISKRSGSSGDTSLASPQVTKKTGKSITIEHTSQADYYEIYATTTTPMGNERRSKVWKATAGVPSPAVGGTLSWSGGNASGSFPGYNPTLVLPNYDTNLDLKYADLANPTHREGITYRLYTSAGGMQESTWGNFCISEMDISRGYVEVQAVDNCCGEGMRWRINCESRFDMFTLDIKDGQLMIGVKPATAQSATAEKDSAKRNLAIKSIKVTTPEGRVLKGQTLDTPQRAMSLSTAGMAKGQYQIEITDVDGNVHKGHFGI